MKRGAESAKTASHNSITILNNVILTGDLAHDEQRETPPGYRVFTIDGDTYGTEVVRLDELKYRPEE